MKTLMKQDVLSYLDWGRDRWVLWFYIIICSFTLFFKECYQYSVIQSFLTVGFGLLSNPTTPSAVCPICGSVMWEWFKYIVSLTLLWLWSAYGNEQTSDFVSCFIYEKQLIFIQLGIFPI